VEWTIAVAVTVAIWLLAVILGSRRRKQSGEAHSGGLVALATTSPSAPPKQVPAKLSAADLLSLVYRLRDQSAQWDAILAALNPTDDAEIQRLLIGIRGPYMFVPHLGLSVIEDGCKRALASSPNADAIDALSRPLAARILSCSSSRTERT